MDASQVHATDLSELLPEGRVNNLIWHSGGGALCMQSVKAAENKNTSGLKSTRMLTIGTAFEIYLSQEHYASYRSLSING